MKFLSNLKLKIKQIFCEHTYATPIQITQFKNWHPVYFLTANYLGYRRELLGAFQCSDCGKIIIGTRYGCYSGDDFVRNLKTHEYDNNIPATTLKNRR